MGIKIQQFLSTPSARRATRLRKRPHHRAGDFYPRPPRGGRHLELGYIDTSGLFLSTPSARRATLKHGLVLQYCLISIHALREEGDVRMRSPSPASTVFLSTPSARRATRAAAFRPPSNGISIHALREEGDFRISPGAGSHEHFYPRPPRGGRPLKLCCRPCPHRFLSTPSARRATRDGDHRLSVAVGRVYFYPRPPRGEQQQKQRQNLYFLINYTTFCTDLEEL